MLLANPRDKLRCMTTPCADASAAVAITNRAFSVCAMTPPVSRQLYSVFPPRVGGSVRPPGVRGTGDRLGPTTSARNLPIERPPIAFAGARQHCWRAEKVGPAVTSDQLRGSDGSRFRVRGGR